MSLVVDIVPDAEPVTLDEAKTHLRLYSKSFDTEIMQVVAAAREWCESQVSRTLRTETTRTLSLVRWWGQHRYWDYWDIGHSTRHNTKHFVQLPYPPLLDITEIKFYDADDIDTVLDAANYQIVLSTDGPGRIEWATNATIPGLSVRADAVRITYTAGYATAIPVKAKQAILLMLKALWGDTVGKDMDAAYRSAGWLLSSCDWGNYA